jgi:hypothetical protein
MKAYNEGIKLAPCPYCGVTGISIQYPTHYSNCEENFKKTNLCGGKLPKVETNIC